MMLPNAQLESFRTRGFLLLPRLLAQDLVDEALREAPAPNWGPKIEPPKILLDSLPPVMSKMLTIVQPYSDALLGEPAGFVEAIWSVHGTGNGFGGASSWHLDGFGRLSRGGTWDEVPGFQLLIGVILTDLSRPRRGNLMLAEGGHLAVAEWMRKKSGEHTDETGKVRESKKFIDAMRSEANIPERIPLLAGAGDVVLVHSMVPHTVDVNAGPTRPVVYFRLGRSDFGGLEKLKNPW